MSSDKNYIDKIDSELLEDISLDIINIFSKNKHIIFYLINLMNSNYFYLNQKILIIFNQNFGIDKFYGFGDYLNND